MNYNGTGRIIDIEKELIGMDPQEIIEMLATIIVDMEQEAGCIGATAKHLDVLFDESIRAESNESYDPLRYFHSVIKEEVADMEAKEEFASITDGLFTPAEMTDFRQAGGGIIEW